MCTSHRDFDEAEGCDCSPIFRVVTTSTTVIDGNSIATVQTAKYED